MAIICKKHKLLFVMVPGTGCTMLGRVLQEQYEGEQLIENAIRKDGLVVLPSKHATLDQIIEHGVMTRDELDEYLVFATIRNPFDRLTTTYQRFVGGWTSLVHRADRRKLERKKDTFSETEYQAQLARLEANEATAQRRSGIAKFLGFGVWAFLTLTYWNLKHVLYNGAGRFNMRERAFPMTSGVDVLIYYERLEEGFRSVLQLANIDKPPYLPVFNKTPGKKPFKSYYGRFSKWFVGRMFSKSLDRFGYSFDGPSTEEPIVSIAKAFRAAPHEPV